MAFLGNGQSVVPRYGETTWETVNQLSLGIGQHVLYHCSIDWSVDRRP